MYGWNYNTTGLFTTAVTDVSCTMVDLVLALTWGVFNVIPDLVKNCFLHEIKIPFHAL